MLNRPRVAPISTQCEQLPLLNAGCIAQVLQLCPCERLQTRLSLIQTTRNALHNSTRDRCDQDFGNEAGGQGGKFPKT